MEWRCWTSSTNVDAGEVTVLDHILKFVMLETVVVSGIAIYTAPHTNNRHLGTATQGKG
jgi:hypothetical protein